MLAIARWVFWIMLEVGCTFGCARASGTQGATLAILMFDKPAMFHPEHLKVKVGQTITWINKGATVHSVTTDQTLAPDAAWVSLPPGAPEFDSDYLNPSESYSYSFTRPGVYRYYCLTHTAEGMRAEVDVEQ